MYKKFTALILAAVAGTALAMAPAFEEVDTDQDGLISAEEAQAIEGLDFGTADANGDGSLDQAEYETATKEG